MPLPTFLRPSLALAVAASALAVCQVPAQTLPRGILVTGTPHTVWSWSASTKCGGGDDFPDVPARPFQVGGTVLWFAGNSSRFASVGTGGTDVLASLQRGVAAGSPSCVQWVAAPPQQPQAPYYPGSVPSTYNTALWMAAPFYDGTTVHALMHNEFHGDWTGSAAWCPTQTTTIYLPCSYWNIVTAGSSDGGLSFRLNQASAGVNVPAIALGNPYVPPPAGAAPTAGPQGMTAQSNILQSGAYYYVLALQLQAPGAGQPALNGTCIWRAPASTGPLVWTGWDGAAYTVAAPTAYPTSGQALCTPVLPAPFRSSWSFNGLSGNVVVLGQDTLANLQAKKVSTAGCPYAPGASASTADAAFVYMVPSKLPIPAPGGQALPRLEQDTERCLLQINSINVASSQIRHAYPSLLDPASAQFAPGDVNFQYSGYLPYLYFTQMNPVGPANPKGWDRDLVRIAVQVFPGQSMDAPIPGR